MAFVGQQRFCGRNDLGLENRIFFALAASFTRFRPGMEESIADGTAPESRYHIFDEFRLTCMRDPFSEHGRPLRHSACRRTFLARAWRALLAMQVARTGATANAADNGRQTASGPADAEVRKSTENRIALLVCCGTYPNAKNIWPARKNGRDLEAALRVHGFDVQVEYDPDRPAFTGAIDRFKQKMRALPDDGRTIGIVYFVGHGMQYEGHNYLLPSGVSIDDPSAKEKAVSLQDDVLAAFPQRYPGLGVAIIDACRDGLSPEEKNGSFNYSTAPQGCIVAFSASAGQVSLSPQDPNQNSFYTAELVKVLAATNEDTPITDIFELTRLRVAQTMSTHSVGIVRKLAQRPHITAGQTGVFRLGRVRPSTAASGAEEEAYARQLAALAPAEVRQLAEAFLRSFPNSKYETQTRVALAGAEDGLKALSSRFVRLSASAFRVEQGDTLFAEDMRKALRGDKDAAARIAEMYQVGSNNLEANPLRGEQWLRYSALLGNAISCYQLYRQLAEKRDPDAEFFGPEAERLGYTPPKGLCKSRKSGAC